MTRSSTESSRRSIAVIAALSPLLLLLACGTAPKTPGPVTPIRAWAPEGCVSKFQPDSYGHVKDSKSLLIDNIDDLRSNVECGMGKEVSFDFAGEKIAMFKLYSRNGASFKALTTEDNGETVTLVVESSHYCGGTPHPPTAMTVFYRVPERTRALATKIVPADEPPCSPNIP